MAPTGFAVVNINGTTINSVLAIPKDVGDTLPVMSDQTKTQLRMSLAELKLIIIDEVFVVSNTTLVNYHQRLKEIFVTPNSKLFAGVSILAVGDLYELPPIWKKPVFENYKKDGYNLCHPSHVLKMIELIEIMRQKDDKEFSDLSNSIRTALQSQDDIKCLQSKSVSSDNYPTNALHIWAENKLVDEHNTKHLQNLLSLLFVLKAVDQYPVHVSKQDIDKVLAKGRSETDGLDSSCSIYERRRKSNAHPKY